MKEKRIKRKWQRLLVTAVLLLSVVIQAQADGHFVPINAGWDDDQKCWWVDVKNIGNTSFENSDIKLGIVFRICEKGKTTNPLGQRTKTWNDETGWTIKSGDTKRFNANGGDNNSRTPDFTELDNNKEYTLEIEVCDHEQLIGINKSYNKGTFDFYLNNTPSDIKNRDFYKDPTELSDNYGVPIETFSTIINGTDVTVYHLNSSDNEALNEYNRPIKLVQGQYYYFDEAPKGEYATRSVLWDKHKVNGQTIFMFKGITAYYRIQKVTKLTNRKGKDDEEFKDHTFLKVEPLNTLFVQMTQNDWNKSNDERTAQFQERDEVFPNFSRTHLKDDKPWGYGCLYIAGEAGFGYGEYDKYLGWSTPWQPIGNNNDKYVLADNQMWVPSPEPNLYKFRLQGGGNISNDKAQGFNVKFYLNNYLKRHESGSLEDWKTYDLVNSWRGNNVAENHSYANSWSSSDYPYLMHLNDTRDFFQITGNTPITDGTDEQKNSPDWENGNFRTRTIGFDSDTPALPEGYIFEITIDLRDKTPETWKKQSDGTNGIEVKVERIKDEFALGFTEFKYTSLKDNQGVTNEDIHYNDEGGNSTSCEVYLSKFNKINKSDAGRNVTKRIKLRDALRFDYGIPFAKQYTTAANTDDIIKFNNLIIHGALSDDDMQYLSWLSRNNKLVNLDLTDAILPNGVIPGPQIIDNETNVTDFGGNSETLVKVTMPTNGVKGIGNNAFKGCTGLTNMAEIVERTHGAIGESAFEGCTNPASTVIDVETITSIGENAFKNCSQIVKFKVPASVEGEKEITTEPAHVGTKFKETKVGIGETAIEAEDFNSGNGTGYYHSDKRGEGGSNYRGDDNANYGIKNSNTFNNNHDIGYNTEGDWYNYTFYVENDGIYKLTAYIGSGQNDDVPREIKATFDGNNDAISFTLSKDEQTGWDGTGIKEKKSDKELLFKKGWHYMKIDVVTTGIELDYYTLNYVRSVEINNSPITDALHANSFEGINPNNCEVVFASNDDATNNYAEYRKQSGWMSLLTKDLNENAVYSCVNQHHADVKMNRRFAFEEGRENHQNNWYSVVFPFEVNAATLINAKDENQNYVFDRAAVLDNGSFNKEGYPNVHFSYLDGQPFLAKVNFTDDHKNESWENTGNGHNNSYEIGDKIDDVECNYVYDNNGKRQPFGTNVIKAGDPFNVRIERAINSDVTFYDVRVFPSNDKEQNVEEKDKSDVNNSEKYNKGFELKVAKEDGNTLFTFVGNMYGDKNYDGNNSHYAWLKEGYYYYSGRIYQGSNDKDNYYLKALRAYLKPSDNTAAAKFLKSFLFGEPTAIGNIEAENAANGNIYNLNGQLVRKGISVEGLPKGIFIVNGKRVVIR